MVPVKNATVLRISGTESAFAGTFASSATRKARNNPDASFPDGEDGGSQFCVPFADESEPHFCIRSGRHFETVFVVPKFLALDEIDSVLPQIGSGFLGIELELHFGIIMEYFRSFLILEEKHVVDCAATVGLMK